MLGCRVGSLVRVGAKWEELGLPSHPRRSGRLLVAQAWAGVAQQGGMTEGLGAPASPGEKAPRTDTSLSRLRSTAGRWGDKGVGVSGGTEWWALR